MDTYLSLHVVLDSFWFFIDVLMFFSFFRGVLDDAGKPSNSLLSFLFFQFGYMIDPYALINRKLSTHATHAVGF